MHHKSSFEHFRRLRFFPPALVICQLNKPGLDARGKSGFGVGDVHNRPAQATRFQPKFPRCDG
jgi:hypothetical protein